MHELPADHTDKTGRAYRLRALGERDRLALEAMYADFQPKRGAQGLPPADPAALRRWLARVLAAGRHIIVEVGGAVLGHGMLVPMAADHTGNGADAAPDERLELAVFLHQSIRDRGIGTEVNRHALALACDAGARRVWLSVEPSNRAAIRSYEKVGFRRLPGSLWAPEVEMEAAAAAACAAGG